MALRIYILIFTPINYLYSVLFCGRCAGLLSLICVRHGAAHVIGAEMWEEMAHIAQETVLANGASDEVTVVAAKSSEIDALPVLADVLVSEVGGLYCSATVVQQCSMNTTINIIYRLHIAHCIYHVDSMQLLCHKDWTFLQQR